MTNKKYVIFFLFSFLIFFSLILLLLSKKKENFENRYTAVIIEPRKHKAFLAAAFSCRSLNFESTEE